MDQTFCNCTFQFIATNIIMAELKIGTDTFHSETFQFPTTTISPHYLFPWLINFSKNIYKLPNTISVSIDMPKDKATHQFIDIFIKFNEIVQHTRNAILKYASSAAEFSDFHSKLFLNFGDIPFIQNIYSAVSDIDPQNTYYAPCHFLNRRIENDIIFSTLEGLMKKISENKIKHIFVHNTTYYRFFLENYHIDLSVFLEKMGIEFVVLDFDVYCEREGEYLQKKMPQSSSRRFSIWPHIDAYWDTNLGIKTEYMALPFKIPVKPFVKIEDDYEILVTSWPRTHNILYFFKPILMFISYLDMSRPFEDFQFFFHALSLTLKYSSNIPLNSKMRIFTLLSEIYFHTNSLFKFEVLQKIKTRRKIHLFGTKEWQPFFPAYYRGQAAQEDLQQMLSNGKFASLLMNANYSYFENNPMFLRLLSANNPYLGFKSVLLPKELSGFSKLEFANIDELNAKIDKLTTLTCDPDLNTSKLHYATQINECFVNLISKITDPNSTHPNIFEKKAQYYHTLFLDLCRNTLDSNKNRIEAFLKRLISNDFIQIEPSKFPWIDRPYFQKMVTLYEQSQAGK